MPQPYLKNGGFEADWQDQPDDDKHRCLIFIPGCPVVERDVDNIFCPPGWRFWFVHNPGTYDQPEGRDARADERVRSGEKAYCWFTFHRCHDAGLFQQIDAGANSLVRFSIYAHAWSNGLGKEQGGKPNDAAWSDGVGYGEHWLAAGAWPHDTGDPWEDAKPNFIFRVGIDPTGGTDPLADTVVWGQGAHIYNGYCHKLDVEAVAQAGVVTVFVRSTTLWAFRHNDTYVDDAKLTVDDRLYPRSDVDMVALGVKNVGDVVTLDAYSPEGLSNVAFVVEKTPGGGPIPLSVDDIYRDEYDIYHWGAHFLPTLPGRHLAVFSADGVSGVAVAFDVGELPVPRPPRGAPREQYERTYVLLPPTADVAWARAVAEARWDSYRWTIGGSADDAGIGDLDSRRVIAVNPGLWPDDLLGWFKQWYPGVVVLVVNAGTPDELRQKLAGVD
ncbi:MAG: hypothetical protein JXA14_26315 [Anaerolineae bacterium]|nr:hypothetical protein [Anaerolineae bacterium]